MPRTTLRLSDILAWADEHRRRTGRFPTRKSGIVRANPGETWSIIDSALRQGSRGLPGGWSLPQLLAERRGYSHQNVPKYPYRRIFEWAKEHKRVTGSWPTIRSGPIRGANAMTWRDVWMALHHGQVGSPGRMTLQQLLDVQRRKRIPAATPELSINSILNWADSHKARTGEWPNVRSGRIAAARGETWLLINVALGRGSSGLPGGSSLAKLLAERRGKRYAPALPKLTEASILQWADAHHARIGAWPTPKSGQVVESPGETWSGINQALHVGLRGLGGGVTLWQLLAKRRGVPNRLAPSKLSIDRILSWADAHHVRTGHWPATNNGQIHDAPGETWYGVERALHGGLRGLRGRTTLYQLLVRHRRARHRMTRPKLLVSGILKWADAHHARTGDWPSAASGQIVDSPGETWCGIAQALVSAGRGLRVRTTLARLLFKHRGAPNRLARPKLSVPRILQWADAHHARTGDWPMANSGKIHESPDETWSGIAQALARAGRGLRVRTSLARLLREHRGVRLHFRGKLLSTEQILQWADAHRERTGRWPSAESGPIPNSAGETWKRIDVALGLGHRGQPAGSSLAKLLDKHRRAKDRRAKPK